MSTVKPPKPPSTGDRIRTARRAARLTQQQLADATGKDRAQIAEWEIGEYTPTLRNLAILARALNVPVTDLWEEPASA